MISPLLNPVFITAVVLAAGNQILEKGFGIFVPILHSYLDDLLCFPLVLTVGLAFYRLRDKNYQLTKWHIWPLFLVYVFIFEIYMPTKSNLYTADIFDVLAYLFGILIFEKTINRKDVISIPVDL